MIDIFHCFLTFERIAQKKSQSKTYSILQSEDSPSLYVEVCREAPLTCLDCEPICRTLLHNSRKIWNPALVFSVVDDRIVYIAKWIAVDVHVLGATQIQTLCYKPLSVSSERVSPGGKQMEFCFTTLRFCFIPHVHKPSVCLTSADWFSWDKRLWSPFTVCFEPDSESKIDPC